MPKIIGVHTPQIPITTPWVVFTASIGFTSVTNLLAECRRVGDMLEVRVAGSGSGAGTNIACNLPSVYGAITIDAAKLVVSNLVGAPGEMIGTCTQNQSFSNGHIPIVTAPLTSVTQVYFGAIIMGTNSLTPTNSNAVFNSGVFSMNFKVPITGWTAYA